MSLTLRSLVALSQLPPVKQQGMAEVIEKQHLSAADTESQCQRPSFVVYASGLNTRIFRFGIRSAGYRRIE
jgi:hypothetical protein